VLAAAALACYDAPPPADTTRVVTPGAAAASCLGSGASGVIRVRADSVGALSSRLTFDELRARCPEARDTIDPWDPSGRSPALLIPAPVGAAVLAVQYDFGYTDPATQPTLRAAPNQPATYWRLQGESIELAGTMRGTAPWANLIRRYGPALVIVRDARVAARFCALPDFEFTLDAPARDSGFVLLDSTSSRIGADARATVITMLARDPSPPGAECGGSGGRLALQGHPRRFVVPTNPAVRRSGDTLVVHAANGTEATFVNRPDGDEDDLSFEYMGTIASGTLHRIDVESIVGPYSAYVHARTGQRFRTAGAPVLSPDGARLASSSWGLAVCDARPRLEILRLTDSLPAIEFTVESRICVDQTAAAPPVVEWLSPDTLAFVGFVYVPTRRPRVSEADTGRLIPNPKLAVRAGVGWRIVPRP
jgi:hypothetical protein